MSPRLPILVHRTHRRLLANVAAALVGAAALGPNPARAQFVTGRVIDSTTRQPLPGLEIWLVRTAPHDPDAALKLRLLRDQRRSYRPDSTAVVRARTNAEGVFTVRAPEPGSYRVRVDDRLMGVLLTFHTPDAYHEAEYVVSAETLRGAPQGRPFYEYEVDELAAHRGAFPLRYPPHLVDRCLEGTASAQFVVTADGRADMRQYRALQSSDPAFAEALRVAILSAAFTPARRDGRAVPQVTQQAVTFAVAPGRTCTPAP